MTLSIEAAIFTILTTNAALADLVGDRVYPTRMPQRLTLPCVTYSRISVTRTHTHDQAGGLAAPTFQFTAYAETPDEAIEVINAVRWALDGYVGTQESTKIYAALSEGERALYETDSQLFAQALDIRIWHKETKPVEPEPDPEPEPET